MQVKTHIKSRNQLENNNPLPILIIPFQLRASLPWEGGHGQDCHAPVPENSPGTKRWEQKDKTCHVVCSQPCWDAHLGGSYQLGRAGSDFMGADDQFFIFACVQDNSVC